jgi:hypothetical protein
MARRATGYAGGVGNPRPSLRVETGEDEARDGEFSPSLAGKNYW